MPLLNPRPPRSPTSRGRRTHLVLEATPGSRTASVRTPGQYVDKPLRDHICYSSTSAPACRLSVWASPLARHILHEIAGRRASMRREASVVHPGAQRGQRRPHVTQSGEAPESASLTRSCGGRGSSYAHASEVRSRGRGDSGVRLWKLRPAPLRYASSAGSATFQATPRGHDADAPTAPILVRPTTSCATWAECAFAALRVAEAGGELPAFKLA